jgi:hypothetical protein
VADTVNQFEFIPADSPLLEPPEGCSKGYEPELRGAYGDRAYEGVAASFPEALLLTWDEIFYRLKSQEESGTRLIDLMRRNKLKAKDQNGTNHCWAYGPTQCVEVTRLVQNQRKLYLSATSVACRVNGFRNQGGWGRNALEELIRNGADLESYWTPNAISRKYDTKESRERSKKYRVTDWIECTPRNPQQMLSLIAQYIPVAVGYNRWSHEVMACWAKLLGSHPEARDVAPGIRNQWRNWGDDNYATLADWGLYPDDAVAPLVAIAS